MRNLLEISEQNLHDCRFEHIRFPKVFICYTSFELMTVIAYIILEVRQRFVVSFLFLSVTSQEKSLENKKFGRLPAAGYTKYRVN